MKCFVGDSHLAAVKAGWDVSKGAYPGVEIEFFGARASLLRGGLRFEAGVLVPQQAALRSAFLKTSGGRDAIQIDRYDAFYVFGPDLSVKRLLGVYRNYRAESHRSRLSAVHRVSDACFRQVVEGLLDESEGVALAKGLRGRTRAPVTLVFGAMPLASNRLPGDDGEDPILRDMVESGDDERLLAGWRAAQVRLEGEHQLCCVNQPNTTRASALGTRREYGVAPSGWERSIPDGWHMNRSYGEAILSVILAAR